MDDKPIFEAVVKAFGGTQDAVAAAINQAFPGERLTREAVSMWKMKGRIPGERVLQINALKPRLSVRFLRPDVYGAKQ